MESRPTGFLMDPQGTGQMRPAYGGDLCRPPGTDASTLAAYHGRYLPSMPLSTGSSFPFLGGMFTGSLPGPPTSPFRTPSNNPNNMRQFWPPTPPPDDSCVAGGYGRFALNTSLFPLFGAPPDNGAFLTQGLVSRLGTATHLSPLIDHKEHSFFSHGIGLGTPLTPTSHVTSPSPYPHLIPSLERHPAYGGHMTLGGKELEDLHQAEADDVRIVKSHLDCHLMNPSPRHEPRSKGEDAKQNCCDKSLDDCCKLSQEKDDLRTHSRLDAAAKNHTRQNPTHKVQPCKIELSPSPSLKPDLLSPPIESPKSPNKNVRKSANAPFATDASRTTPTSVVSHEEKVQQQQQPTRCSQCCANIKDIKPGAGVVGTERSAAPLTLQSGSDSVVPQGIHSSSVLTPASTTKDDDQPQEDLVDKSSYEKELGSSPVITVTDVNDKSPVDESFSSSNKNVVESQLSKLNNCAMVKHVTAAVIPTAPKQVVHRDIHPETICSVGELTSRTLVNVDQSAVVSDQKKTCSDNCVKLELQEQAEKAAIISNSFPCSVSAASFSNKSLNKTSSTSCKVKDMIKNTCSAKQMMCVEKFQDLSPSKSTHSDTTKIPPSSPSTKVAVTLPNVVNPMIVSKSACKNNEKMQCLPVESVRKCNPFKEDSMKTEAVNSRLDCEFAQKPNSSWTKATVSPFNWQENSSQDEQAINLTVSKRTVKPEPSEVVTATEMAETNLKVPPESTITSSSGVIGVCHPNPTPIAMSKLKAPSSVSSISNYSSISVLNQPAEQSTEVHILHRSSKSSFPLVNRNNGTSPVPLKSTISHVTANTSIHRSLKTERLIAKRGKISEMDKMGGRTTLATLAPKLSKNVNFGKDVQTSHTISTSSSVSSTSIVFPATVNPCIPVGIAIAQQRQDTSTTASTGKSQSSVSSNASNILSSNGHVSTNRISADLQTQEVIREQKNQDLPLNNNPTPVDTNLLVTQGPTIVSRQWESEALTRTAMPSSWVAHGSIVAPAVWLGQGAYTAPVAPATSTVPSVAVNPLESSPISLPPGGYQLARDSITGHLLLIPTANIEVMDRPSVWPTFNSSAGAMPIQQLLTQQQHTQYEQVLPQPDSLKMSDAVEASCNVATCDLASNASIKSEDKIEDVSGQVPSVPLATGQTYAFTTFPTQCDPASFSYVLQSSTVMHLAHTQTTASIQTESGRRSQATSPLHCATPSPPPNTCSVQVSVTEDEESDNESDPECCDTIQASGPSQSVTMAIQVDMDSQTNSEEDDEEDVKAIAGKPEAQKMEMCDSANQTETVECDSPKSQLEAEFQCDKSLESLSSPPQIKENSSTVNIKEDIVPLETGLEIVTSEIELAPSLPVESKPVMDFIDHHGLNLLVDSIEEFASREQESHSTENPTKLETDSNSVVVVQQTIEPKMTLEVKPNVVTDRSEAPPVQPTKPFSSPYKTIDTTCTDGLGLLCALAEQRFFEEALNDDSKFDSKEPQKETRSSSPSSQKHSNKEETNLSILKENSFQSNSSLCSADSSVSSSPCHRETTEMEMRLQIEELQKKYKQKQRELELLRNKKEKEMNEEDAKKVNPSSALEAESQDTSKCEEPERPPVECPAENSKNATEEKDVHQNSAVIHEELNKSDDPIDSNFGEETKRVEVLSLEKSKRENEKSKTPFFDETAWFVRRSERIFLSEARAPSVSDKSGKKHSTHKASSSDVSKDKREHPIKLKNTKPVDENSKNKSKSKVLKPKTSLPKKGSMSLCSESDGSSDEKSSEVESSDAASCTSENLPLSTFVEQSSSHKVSLVERQKRMSTDSECSSAQSDDMPLSVLLEQKIPELKSCILKPEDLQENSRLLVLDEGLFYAGHITKSEDPDLYGILIDGDRAARPHMFSKEEILNAAVLEVKPIHKLQLPEGSRICAFWSQQYRCLYPGTVTKASSPLPDPSLLYVEFDDGDSGRIPLNDIRMLPSDFPIVSMEPNPFMILGKRRSRAHSQVSNADPKNDASVSVPPKTDGDRTEAKKLKISEKGPKKNSNDVKVCKDKKSKSKSPSGRSRSSSKSSVGGHKDSKSGSSVGRKESGDEKKKSNTKVPEKKPKDNSCDNTSASKPKKHKKHKDDHHKHHHHHHKHHHHKKHKSERTHESSVIHLSKADSPSSSEQEYDAFILEKSNSELTMKIKKSPSPHTTNHEEIAASKASGLKKSPHPETSSSDDEDVSEPPPKRQKKSKLHASQGKPSKRKDRVPSVEKSKIAAFLPVRQLWRWSGKSYRRPGAKGKAKKEFYRSIQRGKEAIKVGDCAVFLSTGRPHLPYIGRIETMWESWGGKMDVKVKWFYHPEETKSGKKLSQLKGALFQSPHFDENDVQTISHKCEVLSWDEYQRKTVSENIEDNNDTYFLAGTYDPIMGTLILEPGVPNVCSAGNVPEP